MTKFLRFAALTLALIAFGVALSGCGSGSPTKAKDDMMKKDDMKKDDMKKDDMKKDDMKKGDMKKGDM